MRPLFARPSMLGAMLALLVGGGVYTYASGTQTDGGSSGPRVTVVVAAQDIPARTKIEANHLATKELPAEAVLPEAARSADQVVGKFALGPLRTGQQILAAHVGVSQGGSDLAGLVQPGMRAMAFGVSDASAAGGLVSPGDHIDVIAVFDEGGAAVVVASDIEVLAVSAALLGSEPVQKDAKAASNQSPTSVNATVTVAVSPDIAPRIAIGEVLGSLRVSVRRAGDLGSSDAAATSLTQLLGVLALGSR
jgi:pilus assembly protein CpaB